MKYIKNLFSSIKEILLMLGIQYSFLIIIILILGTDKSIIPVTIIIMIIELIYIILQCKIIKFNSNIFYFPYIILGVSISIIYNMVMFKVKDSGEIINIPIILNILCSGIIGPIFEEILFIS